MINRQKAFFSILMLSFLSGAIASVTKIGLKEVPPLSFAFLRFFVASLFILPFILKYKRNLVKDFIFLLPMSLLLTVNIIFFTIGIKKTTATIGQLIYGGAPLLITIIGFYLLKEKLVIQKLTGVILGFLGIIIIIFLPILEKEKLFSGDLVGNLLIAFGVVSYSYYMVFSKEIQKSYSPFIITAMFIFLTTIILFPLSIFESLSNLNWWRNISPISFFSIIYMAIPATIFTYLLNQHAIKFGGSVFASLSQYLTPILTFLFAFILLGERLTLGIMIGGTLVILSIFLTSKE